jgi:DNA polymerase-3 subunit delta
MIIKSYEIQKNKLSFSQCNFFLLYGENVGLKKDIENILKEIIKKKNDNIDIQFFYENEIIDNDDNFYSSVYSESLFSDKKIISLHESTDKIIKKVEDIYEKYPENTFLIFFSGVLDKKSKLRNFFEKNKKTVCIPCYLDNERDLENIAQMELKKNNVSLSREAINLLVEKSNSDRGNLKNEIEKIKSYSLNKKKIELEEIKLLINFSGDYKSDILVNECLSCNVKEYKKIISELNINTANQILLLRILSIKVQRLLKIKEQENKSKNLDSLISMCKPPIFWKEKPIVKKQLTIWSFSELKKIVTKINNTELMCKKNPQISEFVFCDFLLKVCTKANSYF